MIVTCPGCSSKYRVRDEAVPAGGAELKCPSCGAVFVAHPPRHSEEEIAGALERVTKARDAAEARVSALEGEKQAIEQQLVEYKRHGQEMAGRAQQLEAQILVLQSELGAAGAAQQAALQPLEAEVARLRGELARAVEQAQGATAAELRAAKLAEELAKIQAAAAAQAPELKRLADELLGAQKTAGRLYTELDQEKSHVARLQAELAAAQSRPAGDGAQVEQLRTEVQTLREELARASASSATAKATNGSAPPADLVTLVAAVGPMLWGLEQSITYLEPYGASEPTLASHVRQLQLLQAVLKRLASAAQ